MLTSKIEHKINLLWEKYKGIDFSHIIPVAQLGLDSSTVNWGSSSVGRTLNNVLKKLDVTPYDSIIDIGCAKGGAVYTLSKHPFGKTDGVEISKVLADIAVENLAKLSVKKAKIYHADALEFDGYQDYNYFYLYNPFGADILNRVLDKIVSTPRAITLIYNFPKYGDVVMQKGFTKVQDFPGTYGHKISIYTYK